MFDRICIINLAHRSDRRREMTRELARLGLRPGRGDVDFFEAIRPLDAGPFPSIGARGCFLSHLAVLEDARRDGLDSVLILEDDATFVSDVVDRLPAVAAALAQGDWDVFYGGYRMMPPDRPDARETVSGPVPADREAAAGVAPVDPEVGMLTTHCVAFRGAAIAETVDFLKALMARPDESSEGGPMHVDGALSWYRRTHPQRRTLAAVPAIAHQRPSRSDIFERLAWYDRIAGLAPWLAILRRVKHRLRP